MSVLRIDAFRVKPSRLAEALDLIRDLKPILLDLGARRARMMTIDTGGPSSGIYYGELEFESMAHYAVYSTAITKHEAGQKTLRSMSAPDGPTTSRSSMTTVVIDTLGKRTEGYQGGVELVREFDVPAGRMAEALKSLEPMVRVHADLGGYIRLIRPGVGAPPSGNLVTVVEYPDITTLYAFLEKTQSDPDVRGLVARSNQPESSTITREISIHREVAV